MTRRNDSSTAVAEASAQNTPSPLATEQPLGPGPQLGVMMPTPMSDPLSSFASFQQSVEAERQKRLAILMDEMKKGEDRLAQLYDTFRTNGATFEPKFIPVNGHVSQVHEIPVRRTGRVGRPKGSKNKVKGEAASVASNSGTRPDVGQVTKRNKGGINKTATVLQILIKNAGKDGMTASDVSSIARKEFKLSPIDVSAALQALRRATPPKAHLKKVKGHPREGLYFAI